MFVTLFVFQVRVYDPFFILDVLLVNWKVLILVIFHVCTYFVKRLRARRSLAL